MADQRILFAKSGTAKYISHLDLMHTMERYFTSGGNMEITDSIAEGLMRTVMKNAVILRDEPKNYDARAEVMWAGSLSHNGLTGCGNNGGDWGNSRDSIERSIRYLTSREVQDTSRADEKNR